MKIKSGILISALIVMTNAAQGFAQFDPAMRVNPRVDEFVQRIHARHGVLPRGAHRQPMATNDFLSYLNTLDSLHARNEIELSRDERYTMRRLRGILPIDNPQASITDPTALRGSQNINSAIYGFNVVDDNDRGDNNCDDSRGNIRDNNNCNNNRRNNCNNNVNNNCNDNDSYGVIINLNLTGEGWARTGGGGGNRAGGRGIISPELRGYIGNLSFYSGLDVWTEYRSYPLFKGSNFQPYNGTPYTVYGRREDRDDGGNMRASDQPRAGVAYRAGRITVETAIDYLRLGPAVHNPLTLSGHAPPITYARAIFDLGRVEYFHAAGVLRSQRDKPKYIYSNGLRGAAMDGRFTWGISEVMVTGSTTNQQDGDPNNQLHHERIERGWEWAYFIPFVPMVFVEHYVGDLDNAALSFDFSLAFPRDFRFYGELFLDDIFTPWEILSDDWGNKWALTLGAQYFTRIANRDVSAGVEWSRVEPWVYTHTLGGSHRYDHFDKPLGSQMGPNSQSVVISGDMAINRRIATGIKLTSLQSNPTSRGGNITDIFQPESASNADSETKEFLGDGTVHYLRPGIYGRYDPFGPFSLNVSFEVDVAEEKGRVHAEMSGTFRF